MSEWNAATYEGKDTILRVVRHEAERFFALAEPPETWHTATACDRWSTRDIVGHLVDTTEGYFRAFDAARTGGEVAPPHGLEAMSRLADEGATALRGVPQQELLDRLKTDFSKMQEILAALGPDEWTGLMVSHKYMGPLPASVYAAFQLMDYGVHSWDIRQASGRAHAVSGDVADLLVPSMFAIWQGTARTDLVTEPFTVGIRVTGRNAGDYRVTVGPDGLGYEQGPLDDLPTVIDFDAASLVLTAFGRINGGTVRGDMDLAERYLNLFFRI